MKCDWPKAKGCNTIMSNVTDGRNATKKIMMIYVSHSNVVEVQGEQTAAILHMATSRVRQNNNAT